MTQTPQFLAKPVEIEPVVWQHQRIGNLPIDVTTQIYTNHEEGIEGVPTALVLPGYGEHAWAAKKGLAALSRLGVPAIAAVLNAEVVPATTADIEGFVNNVGREVAEDLVERASLEPGAPGIGESLGGFAVARTTKESPETFGDIAILQGVGTNGLALKCAYTHPKQRRQAFTRRFARVVTGPHNASPLAQLQAGRSILTQLAEDAWPPTEHRFRRQFRVAADADTIPLLIDHAEAGHKVMIILGKKDPLIRDEEVRQSLAAHLDERGLTAKQAGIHVTSTDAKHAYMGFKAGQRHLEIAACGLGLAKTKRRDNLLAEG